MATDEAKATDAPKPSLDWLPFTQITIDGFRALRNLTLSDLGLINVLVGQNNCGKTSVLEAMSIACNPFDPNEWFAAIRRRDFGRLDESPIDSLRWCFDRRASQKSRIDGGFGDGAGLGDGSGYGAGAQFENVTERKSRTLDNSMRMLCRFHVEGSTPTRELRASLNIQPEVDNPNPLQHSIISDDPELNIDPANEVATILHTAFLEPDRAKLIDLSDDLEEVKSQLVFWEPGYTEKEISGPSHRGSINSRTLTPYSYQMNQLQVKSQSRTFLGSTESKSRASIDLLKRFDAKIRDAGISSQHGKRPSIYIDHEELGFAPLSIFGDGLRRAFLLANTLEDLKGGGLLLIDEVEAGIYVEGLKKVFHWLVEIALELQVQIVVTTHSLEALDGIASAMKDHLNHLAVFRLEQQEEKTHAQRIGGETYWHARHEWGMDVR